MLYCYTHCFLLQAIPGPKWIKFKELLILRSSRGLNETKKHKRVLVYFTTRNNNTKYGILYSVYISACYVAFPYKAIHDPNLSIYGIYGSVFCSLLCSVSLCDVIQCVF